MSASTICRACGQPIAEPAPDRNVCETCSNDGSLRRKELARLAYRATHGDDSDLTQQLWRLRAGHRRTDPVERLFFWFFMAMIGILLAWLGKQAGLWG